MHSTNLTEKSVQKTSKDCVCPSLLTQQLQHSGHPVFGKQGPHSVTGRYDTRQGW